jgi:hypothetical protein
LPTNQQQQQQQQQKQQQQLLFLQRIESAGLLLPKIVAHLGVLEISRASGGAVASVLHNGTRPGNHILVALLVYYCALRTTEGLPLRCCAAPWWRAWARACVRGVPSCILRVSAVARFCGLWRAAAAVAAAAAVTAIVTTIFMVAATGRWVGVEQDQAAA